MQCSDSLDEEFGWECMLGKLCRLAKCCQRASTLDAQSDPSAAIGQPEFDWYYAELYVAPGKRVAPVAKKLQLVTPVMHHGNNGREAVTIASIAVERRARRRWVHPTHSLRCRGEEVRFASPCFVAIVEIEENFAHVAAMAGMASGDVGASDQYGHFGAQIVDKFLHKFAVG